MIGDEQLDDELQVAMDWAFGAIAWESAAVRGLVPSNPSVDVARCRSVIAAGRLRGLVPSRDAIERYVTQIVLDLPAQPAKAKRAK